MAWECPQDVSRRLITAIDQLRQNKVPKCTIKNKNFEKAVLGTYELYQKHFLWLLD